MYKGKYLPSELSLETFTTLETKTIKREDILEDLWKMYNDGKYLSEHEKEFIFLNRYQKEQFENSGLNDNYFISLYLIYANDLHGHTALYKKFDGPLSTSQLDVLSHLNFSSKTFDKNRIELIGALILIKINPQEVSSNLEYLKKSAKDWEEYLEINRGQTTDKLLKEFISETFSHLKEIKKQIRVQLLGNNAFLHKKLQLFLFSKYAFITSKKIIETYDPDKTYYSLKLNGEILRFNEYSITHILMRHYAQGIRNYNFINNKSIHIGDFPFDEIHLKLSYIFEKIDTSKILDNNYFISDIVNLRFTYRGTKYFLGTKIDKNQNEKGKIPFRRIETFHIIEDSAMLNELSDKFTLTEVDTDISLYTQKI